MAENSGIQWTTHTWNQWQGCQKVSPGCDNCYMFRDKRRYGQDPETVVLSKPATFNRPLRWNAEALAAGRIDRVFVASWADFFSREADEWRDRAWEIIRQCPHLTFQILTKRHARIADHLPSDWSAWAQGYPNVWLGVSAEDQEWWKRRVPELVKKTSAEVRFVSYEPALGPLGDFPDDVSAAGIDWVIIGGESGYNARPFHVEWARGAIDICRTYGAAVFVKQLGSNAWMGGKPLPLRDSHGGDMAEWPEDLRVREFPR